MKSIRILFLISILFLSSCINNSSNQEKSKLVFERPEFPFGRETRVYDGMTYVFLYDGFEGQYYGVVNYTNDSLAREFYIKSINQLNQKNK